MKTQSTDMTSDAATVVREVLEAFSDRNIDRLANLFADDIENYVPFGGSTFPPVKGRAALLERLASLYKLIDPLILTPDVLYPTPESEIVLLEYHSDGRLTANGAPYLNQYVGVFRVEAGKLMLWREYHNPLVYTKAAKLAPAAAMQQTVGVPQDGGHDTEAVRQPDIVVPWFSNTCPVS